jgi:hypothetical protein
MQHLNITNMHSLHVALLLSKSCYALLVVAYIVSNANRHCVVDADLPYPVSVVHTLHIHTGM